MLNHAQRGLLGHVEDLPRLTALHALRACEVPVAAVTTRGRMLNRLISDPRRRQMRALMLLLAALLAL